MGGNVNRVNKKGRYNLTGFTRFTGLNEQKASKPKRENQIKIVYRE